MVIAALTSRSIIPCFNLVLRLSTFGAFFSCRFYYLLHILYSITKSLIWTLTVKRLGITVMIHLHRLGHVGRFGVQLAPETVSLNYGAVVLLMALRSFGALSPFRIPFQLL